MRRLSHHLRPAACSTLVAAVGVARRWRPAIAQARAARRRPRAARQAARPRDPGRAGAPAAVHGRHRTHPLHQPPAALRLARRRHGARRCCPAPTGRLWLTGDGRAAPRAAVRLRRRPDRLRRQAGHALRRHLEHRLPRAAAAGQGHAASDTHSEPPTLADDRQGRWPSSRKSWTLSGARADNDRRPADLHACGSRPRTTAACSAPPRSPGTPSHGAPLRAAIYAQGQLEPVLELRRRTSPTARSPTSDVTPTPPADAKVVAGLGPPARTQSRRRTHGARRDAASTRSPAADFPLSAPAKLAGLPRQDVRLVVAPARTRARSSPTARASARSSCSSTSRSAGGRVEPGRRRDRPAARGQHRRRDGQRARHRARHDRDVRARRRVLRRRRLGAAASPPRTRPGA